MSACHCCSPPFPLAPARPVNPHPEPQWSGGHRGLALYVSRLLTPVWDVKVITPSRGNAAVWKARLTEQTMSVSGCAAEGLPASSVMSLFLWCGVGGGRVGVFVTDCCPWVHQARHSP